jgi:hypothetical protein
MAPEEVVQRQVEAYNARDPERFLACYAEDVRVFRPPAPEPTLAGKEAFARFYADNRFNLPRLHAEILARMVVGNRVIDHERITGVRDEPIEAVAVYEVADGRIRFVWFFYAE